MAPIGFVGLPCEIRDTTYEMVFDCYYVHPNYRCREPAFGYTHKKNCLYVQRFPIEEQEPEHVLSNDFLALLFVNRQISAEAKPVFYKNTLFTGTEATNDGLFSFVKGCGSERANLIRTVEFGPTFYDKPDSSWSDNDQSSIFEALRGLQNLRTLRIWTWERSFQGLRETLMQAGMNNLLGSVVVIIEQIFEELVLDKLQSTIDPTGKWQERIYGL